MMDRDQFLFEWGRMSFEERAAFVRLVIVEECIDRQVPIPDIEILPTGMSLERHGEELSPLGRTFLDERLIQIYGGATLASGDNHFDNPWQAVATAFHESSHWFRANDGSPRSNYESEEMSESYAVTKVQDWQRAMEQYEGPPDPNVWNTQF